MAVRCDRPWERKVLDYSSVVWDQGRYRMWYRVDEGDPRIDRPTDRTWTCYAESRDGIHWEKPELGLVSHGGSTRNNIVLEHNQYWNASILLDPKQPRGAAGRYKMILLYYNHQDKREQIHGFISSNGFRWRPSKPTPSSRTALSTAATFCSSTTPAAVTLSICGESIVQSPGLSSAAGARSAAVSRPTSCTGRLPNWS